VLPLLLIGLALANNGFILEPAHTGFVRHGGSFSQFLTKTTAIALLATSTVPRKPVTDAQTEEAND